MATDAEWNDAALQVAKQIVRIETNDGHYGTGFVTHAAYDLRGVATALHVVEDAVKEKRQIDIRYDHDKVLSVGPGSGKDAIVLTAPPGTSDSALMLVRGAIALPQPAVPLIKHGHVVVVGVEVEWLGFPQIADRLCFFSGRVSSVQPDKKLYLVDGTAISGVSGGPMFYLEGGRPTIVGAISGYYYTLGRPRGVGEATISMPGLAAVSDVELLTRLAVKEGEPGSETIVAGKGGSIAIIQRHMDEMTY